MRNKNILGKVTGVLLSGILGTTAIVAPSTVGTKNINGKSTNYTLFY